MVSESTLPNGMIAWHHANDPHPPPEMGLSWRCHRACLRKQQLECDACLCANKSILERSL